MLISWLNFAIVLILFAFHIQYHEFGMPIWWFSAALIKRSTTCMQVSTFKVVFSLGSASHADTCINALKNIRDLQLLHGKFTRFEIFLVYFELAVWLHLGKAIFLFIAKGINYFIYSFVKLFVLLLSSLLYFSLYQLSFIISIHFHIFIAFAKCYSLF